ncbi:ATP-binding protein [Streptomyces sp. NPDC002845]
MTSATRLPVVAYPAVPVRPQRWAGTWPMTLGAPRLARLHTRTRLTMTAWAGDQEAATAVVAELVHNAVRHVGTGEVTLALSVAQDEDLLIEVSDSAPEFDGFDEAVAERKQTGLGLVRALGGARSAGAARLVNAARPCGCVCGPPARDATAGALPGFLQRALSRQEPDYRGTQCLTACRPPARSRTVVFVDGALQWNRSCSDRSGRPWPFPW